MDRIQGIRLRRRSSRDPQRWEKERQQLDPRKSGPDSLIGITEGGRTIFWFVLVLVIGAVLVAGFLAVSGG